MEFVCFFPAIAQHLGKSTTMSSVEHRFRPIRKWGELLAEAVNRGQDPEDIDVVNMSPAGTTKSHMRSFDSPHISRRVKSSHLT